MAQTTAEFLIEQGKAEGKQDAVLKLLQLQFQHVPETLSREIRNIHNLTLLDTLLEQAMTAQSFRGNRYAVLLRVSPKRLIV